MLIENLIFVKTKDNVQIAIWHIFDSEKQPHLADCATLKAQNIFLTHGTFSDKKTCLRIAEYLAKLGHNCYIMEWRAHGASSTPKDKFNFETVATYDYEATFRYFFEELKLNNLHCVTHSGGGVGLTMFLIQNPHYIDKINSASMFACQAYGAASNPISYVKILVVKLLTRLLGYIPAKKLKLGPFNESYYTMSQWYNWNLRKNFHSSSIKQKDINTGVERSAFTNPTNQQSVTNLSNINGDDSFDYRQYMPTISVPIYAISAKGDKFISPTQGCLSLFNDFNNSLNNNSANVFREYALSNGDLDDYSHSRILNSRPAAKEIWPTVAAWIDKHAN